MSNVGLFLFRPHETSSTESLAGSESLEVPEGEWEIEEIVDFEWDNSGGRYQMKWKDWDAEFNTWEFRSNLLHCDEELLRFYRKRKEEARAALENSKYVELPTKKLVSDVPPDPRPFDVRVQEFYDVSGRLAEEDILNEFQQQTLKCLHAKPRWRLGKVNKFIEDAVDGKLSDDEVKALKNELLLIEVDTKRKSLLTEIKKWENHINMITGGRPKITIENEVDTSGPPIEFEFVNENVFANDVSIPTDSPLGCDCETDRTSCFGRKSKCCAMKSGYQFAYTKCRRVKLSQGNPIYECNSKCSCGPECLNRVVQDGKSDHKLCIFRTSNGRGWGLKTLKVETRSIEWCCLLVYSDLILQTIFGYLFLILQLIKRGTFVTLYVGEVIQSDEAERRGKDYDEAGCTYLFDLDFIDQDNYPYSVDSTKYGNVARFINHSCSPNLGVYAVYVDCINPNLPKLAMFAVRDIRRNEELTFDYDLQLSESKSQSEEEHEKEKVEKETPARKNTKCFCGALV
ncbi:Histone-lysine N-methyltransferase SUV39H2 [Orchesella cincta]|uniref:Histone-lysine N-methyltransferase n=1 Tax=Orchesella cincta TaxID=48709 RepID=A0A1D2N1T9_ORCCI|nr:Histone-lysine N-methyltransferase SUV39H2 [Orchesella cincta]